MTNSYVSLPVPIGNGAGTAVDVSGFGALKTVVAVGTAQCSLNIEFNNDSLQAGSWQSLSTIQNAGFIVATVAAMWMRVRVTNFNKNVGGTSSVTMGGTADGASFVSLPVALGNGAEAPVDVSAVLGTFKTVQVGGAFQGTLLVEVSEDGSTEWAQPFSFQGPGAQSMLIIARFMRTRRIGVPVINPGLPLVNVGFAFPTPVSSGSSGVPDGNYGDITVSGGGTVFTVNPLPQSRITNLVADLASKISGTRTLTTTAPLTIDGGASADLSANRTFAIGNFSTTQSGIVVAGGAPGNVLRGDNTWSTIVQMTAALNQFTTLLKGMVPASGAAANFLRGDATWSTIAQVTAVLNEFTDLLQGLVPASGGGSSNFLRADAVWAQPTISSLPRFDTFITPAPIAFGLAYDNWDPGSPLGQNTLIRCTTDGVTRSVRGLIGGVNGITVTLMNVNGSSAALETWAAEDPAAAAANRFRTGFSSGGCTYYYDGLLSRWVLITGTP